MAGNKSYTASQLLSESATKPVSLCKTHPLSQSVILKYSKSVIVTKASQLLNLSVVVFHSQSATNKVSDCNMWPVSHCYTHPFS